MNLHKITDWWANVGFFFFSAVGIVVVLFMIFDHIRRRKAGE
ncbi:hypothetical protein [Marinithermofilum abyssi]|nr:hypothetical protein [Marinithermofilum abyssi]